MTRYIYLDDEYDSLEAIYDIAIQDVPDDYFWDEIKEYSVDEVLETFAKGNPFAYEDILTNAEQKWIDWTVDVVEGEEEEEE